MEKSIKRNALLKMSLNVFNILIPLVVGPYLARIFDPGLYNTYNNALAVVSVFIPIASFGIYNYGMRYIARVRDDGEKVSRLFTQLFFIGLITNLVGFFLFIAYAFCFGGRVNLAIYAALSIQILANIVFTEWMNEAFEMYGFIMIKTVIFRMLYVGSIFLFVRKPDDVPVYALLISMSTFLNNLASFLYIKRKVKFALPLKRDNLRPVVKSLFFLVLITNANILFTQLDKLFLSWFSTDPIATTCYTMPQTILYTILNIVNALVLVTVPRLSYYLSNGRMAEYLSLQQRSSQTFFMIMFPVSIGLATMSNFVMELYGGAQYAAAGPVLLVFSLRNLLLCFDTVMVNQVTYLYGRENTMVRLLFTSGALNLLLDSGLVLLDRFTSIPALTPVNLVITTAFSEVVMTALQFRLVRSLNPNIHLLGFRNLKYLLLSLSFPVVSFLVGLLKLGFLLNGAMVILLCVLLYFGVLLLARDPLAIEYLRSVFGKLFSRLKKG